MAESFDLSLLFEEFRDEAGQQLEALQTALLEMERRGALPEGEQTVLFRALHTLKGNAGMLGLIPIRDYVHALEGVFRAAPAGWTPESIDPLFRGAAALRRATESVGTEAQEEAFRLLSEIPPEAPAAGEAAQSEAPPPPVPGPRDPEAPEADARSELLRVPFAKLDTLLAQVADLAAVAAGLREMADRNRAALDAIGVRRPLADWTERLDATSELLRTSAMELRLVPVGRVLGRFPALIRDLAREQGKRIQVEVRGETTEMDKSTVDALAEPLLHLVRNAVDHGIDTPEQREARGKPPEGTVALRAGQSGDRVRIEVEDDGSGLDRAAILRRAREQGLVRPGDDLAPEEIDRLIFRPGFSTRSEASTLSGRGVGLDVVYQSAARLRGSLEVEPGERGGVRFTLVLPLTVALVPAVLFESAGELLAVPSAEVEETLRSPPTEYVGNARVVRRGDELIPLARPARLFGWEGTKASADGERFLVIVRRGARAAAVTADRLVDQRTVVVKAVPAQLGTLPGVSGVTIAADGRPVLLLDPGGIIDLNLESQRRSARVG